LLLVVIAKNKSLKCYNMDSIDTLLRIRMPYNGPAV